MELFRLDPSKPVSAHETDCAPVLTGRANNQCQCSQLTGWTFSTKMPTARSKTLYSQQIFFMQFNGLSPLSYKTEHLLFGVRFLCISDRCRPGAEPPARSQ